MDYTGFSQKNSFRLRGPSVVLLVVFSFVSFVNATFAGTFRIIDSDQEAAQVRIDMIQQAREEIFIELYRASEDKMVLSHLALLRDAVRRGVEVRFLIDATFNRISKPLLAHLVQEGMAIKEYHPFRIAKLRWLTRRLHDKLVLVDGKHMVIGGRNFENPWFGIAGKNYVKRAYVDRDVYVAGKVVETTRRYFMRLWRSQEVDVAALGMYDPTLFYRQCIESRDEPSYALCEESRIRARGTVRRAAALIGRHRALLEKSTFVHLNPATDWSAGQRNVSDIRFFHDPVGRKGKDPGTFEAFLEYVDSAQDSVLIESPYFILSKNAKETLARAIDRGVQVRVLTNSLASTQNFYAQGGYEGKKADLVQLGLEIWEYKGPKMLHAKSIVIDDKIAIVGNFNIDPRSQFLNTELAVAAHDEVLARQLRTSIDAHLANAWLIGPDGIAIGEGSRFPRVSSGRILKLRFYQLFALLFKNQL